MERSAGIDRGGGTSHLLAARVVGSGKGLDCAHHAVVLVQQDVAVVDPPAREVEKPRPDGDLAERRHGRRVLVVAHRDRPPVDGDDLVVVDVDMERVPGAVALRITHSSVVLSWTT